MSNTKEFIQAKDFFSYRDEYELKFGQFQKAITDSSNNCCFVAYRVNEGIEPRHTKLDVQSEMLCIPEDVYVVEFISCRHDCLASWLSCPRVIRKRIFLEKKPKSNNLYYIVR
jgi:hypothetical protein